LYIIVFSIKVEDAFLFMSTEKSNKTVAVVGLGYVGLPLLLLASRSGYKAVGFDIDTRKIDLLKQKKSPFVDNFIEKELKETSFDVTGDFSQINSADIVILCVPTPVYENHMPNLEPLEGACRSIAPFIKSGQLVILESTVNPGVSDEIVIPLLEKESGLKGGKDFYFAHCPERINPGDAEWNIKNINRVVGSIEPIGLEMACSFYRSIISGEIKPMGSLKEAEAVKIVENSFRDVNIAFVNELAMSFSHLGIDVLRVIEGAATKPFAFMAHFPGCGVGGHCIPVDPYYLIQYAEKNGFSHRFLALARDINNGMPKFTANRAVEAIKRKGIDPFGAKVAVLGLSYKADIDDCRESPAFQIIKELEKDGLKVSAFDPFVPERSTASSLDDAVDGSAAIVLATAHTQFRGLKPSYFLDKGVDVLIDGRNCFSKEEFLAAGIKYEGVGR